MRPTDFAFTSVLGAACLAAFPGCSNERRPRPDPPAQEDLHQGHLGHPLGTYLTIRGVRDTSGKSGASTLRVDKVNGVALDPPVSMWIDGVVLSEDERVELKGYESGRFIGVTDEVARATGQVTQAAWQFQRYFVATSIESGGVRGKK